MTALKNVFKIVSVYFISYFIWICSRLLQLTEIRGNKNTIARYLCNSN